MFPLRNQAIGSSNWCQTDCPSTTDRMNRGDGQATAEIDGVDKIATNRDMLMLRARDAARPARLC